jgi:hypothetical protein
MIIKIAIFDEFVKRLQAKQHPAEVVRIKKVGLIIENQRRIFTVQPAINWRN